MIYRYEKHYTREEARALLPQVREWLKRVTELRAQFGKQDAKLASLLAAGNEIGGDSANKWVKLMCEIKTALNEFKSREIQIKDIDRGLIDFPAIIGGREVFLCWEQDEDDIEFWHDLDSGYAGRERLS
jgi:hypothetical protein